MARASPAVLSFNAGKLSPRLESRVDLEKYQSGCRTLQNYLPLVQGGASKRGGFRFVTEAKRAAPAQFYLDSFNVTTAIAGTTFARTGYGFQPKAILVWMTGRTGSVTSAGRASPQVSFGFAASASQTYAAGLTIEDAAATSDTYRFLINTRVGAAVDTAGNFVGLLDFLSFDADGVTLEIDVQYAASHRITLLAIGGDTVRAAVKQFQQPTEVGTQTVVTGDFRPNCAIFASSLVLGSTEGVYFNDAGLCVGAAAGADIITQATTVARDIDNLATMNSASYSRMGDCLASTSTTGSTTVIMRAQVESWTSTGFNFRVVETIPAGQNRNIGVLALAGADFQIGSVQTLTSTGVDIPISGLPFTPKFSLFMSDGKPESTLELGQEDFSLSIGAATSTSAQNAQGAFSNDNEATSVAGTALDVDAVYVNMADTAATVEGAMRVHAVGSDSITLRMSDADPSPAFVWYLTGGDLAFGPPALRPFKFSREDAYTLEFGAQYLRFYRNGSPVLEGDVAITATTNATPVVVTTAIAHGYTSGDDVFISETGIPQIDGRTHRVTVLTSTTFSLDDSTAPGATSTTGMVARIYEIDTPYDARDVHTLDTRAQSADVIYIAHPDYAPRKLSRTDHTAWTLDEIDFDWFPFSPENADEDVTIGASAVTGSVTLTSPTGLFRENMVGARVKLREVPEASHPEWTENIAYNDGYEGFIGSGSGIAVGDTLQFEGRVYEIVHAHGAATPKTGFTPPVHEDGIRNDGRISLRFVNYGYGYAQITSVTDNFRVIATVIKELPRSSISADIALTSTTAANPVSVTSAAPHELDTGDKVYLFGITTADELNNRTFTITRTGASTFTLNGEDGTTYGVGSGGTAVQYAWATNTTTTFPAFYPSLFRWSFGAWSVDRGYPITAALFEDRLWWWGTQANPQTGWGSRTSLYEDHRTTNEDDGALVVTLNAEDPIEWAVGKDALQIGTGGAEFGTRDGDDPLTASTVAALLKRRSEFGSRTGVFPVRVGNVTLFVVSSGRKLREHVFDADATAGYVAPDLTRLSDEIALGIFRQLAFQAEPDRLLWATLEDGSLVCFTYERQEDVYGWHDHPVGGTAATVESLAVIPHPEGAGDQLWACVGRTIGGETRYYIEALVQSWLRSMSIEDAFFVDSGLTYDGTPATTVNGLHHLIGESVEVLADGISVGPLTVSATGTITLTTAASVVTVGLRYAAALETMRLEAGGDDGTSQGKTGRVTHLVARLDQTGHGLFMGASVAEATEPVELKNRRTGELTPVGQLFDGDTRELPWPGGFEAERRLAFVHATPLPCTITGLWPRVVKG